MWWIQQLRTIMSFSLDWKIILFLPHFSLFSQSLKYASMKVFFFLFFSFWDAFYFLLEADSLTILDLMLSKCYWLIHNIYTCKKDKTAYCSCISAVSLFPCKEVFFYKWLRILQYPSPNLFKHIWYPCATCLS